MEKNNKTNKKNNKLFFIFLTVFFVLLVVLGSYYLPGDFDTLGIKKVVRGIESASLSWRFSSRILSQGITATALSGVTQKKESEGIYRKIIIASLDDASLVHFGSYPLDNTNWANMLNKFNSEGNPPDIVLFDLFFSENSQKQESEKALVNAFRNYKGIIGQDMTFYSIPGLKTDLSKGMAKLPDSDIELFEQSGMNYFSPEVQDLKKFEVPIKGILPNVITYSKIRPIMTNIAPSLSFAGSINMDPEDDLYWKNPLIVGVAYYLTNDGSTSITNVYYPSVALAASIKLLKSDISNILVEPGFIVIRNASYNNKVLDFKIPVDNNYRLSVNYKSTPDSGFLKVIPLKDILRAGLRRNAILLVGIYAQGTADNMWQSPLRSMPSTDHLAYTIGTIMNRDFIIKIPEWINALYVILFTLAIGLLVLRGIRTTIAAFILSLALPFGLGFGLFQFNIQIITLIPLVSSVLALIISEVYILLTEEKEKRFIKSTFSKYVSPDLVNILIQNPDMLQLGGLDKEATILFSDIRSFTTLSEGMTPMELISFLNIYLSRMTDIVMETHGTLDKYIGDAVVAFWGTPIELPNHALNACQAAVKMIQGLHEFNDEQAKVKQDYKPINIGIGLNSGAITVGNIGSDKKKNYTAIGDNATIAEDLQDENKTYKTQIIISENTYAKVKDKVVVRELDIIHVKGQEKPIKIFELLDVTD